MCLRTSFIVSRGAVTSKSSKGEPRDEPGFGMIEGFGVIEGCDMSENGGCIDGCDDGCIDGWMDECDRMLDMNR